MLSAPDSNFNPHFLQSSFPNTSISCGLSIELLIHRLSSSFRGSYCTSSYFAMKCSYSILALSLGTVGLSTPLQSSAACPAPRCRDIVLPIKAAANNTVFPPYPKSTAPGVMYEYLGSFDPATLPTAPVSGTFAISATYCEPSVKVEGREGTIQFLLHGLSATKVSSSIPVACE